MRSKVRRACLRREKAEADLQLIQNGNNLWTSHSRLTFWPVSHLIFTFSFLLRLWNKLPKIENIPSVPIDRAAVSPNVTFVRWKVHQDWVTQVRSHVFLSSACELGGCGDNLGVPAELTSVSVGQILRRLSGGCFLIQWGVFLSRSRFFLPSFLKLLPLLWLKAMFTCQTVSLFSCLLFFSLRSCAAANRRREAANWDLGGLLRREDQKVPAELDAAAPSITWPDGIQREQRSQDIWPLREAQRAGHRGPGQTRACVEPTFFRVRNHIEFFWFVWISSECQIFFLILFLITGNQLVFWKATVLPSATSASPRRTVRSSPSLSTTQWK